MRRHFLPLAAAFLFLLAGQAQAARFPTPEPSGIDLAVSGIHDENFHPSLASDGRGNSVAIWGRWADGGNDSEVVGQRLGPAGEKLGRRFRVNTHLPSYQGNAVVAMNENGQFAVVWVSSGQDGQTSGIYARAYNADGTPATRELAVNTHAGAHSIPTIGIDRKGRFAVAWYNERGVLLRRFDRAGIASGPEVVVAPGASPSIAMSPEGKLTLAWRDWDVAARRALIRVQRFGRSGEAVTPVLPIGSRPIPGFGSPSVALTPDGGFVVAWDSCDLSSFSQGCEVRLQRFDSQGKPRSAELTASPADLRGHTRPAVAVEPGGYMAVAWQDCGVSDGFQTYDCRIQTLFFDPSGQAAPAPATLIEDASLQPPSLTAAVGYFVVAYDSVNCDVFTCGYTFPRGAYAWRYRIPRPRP